MSRGDAAMFRRTQLYNFTVERRNIGIYETAWLRESVNSDGTLNNSVIYEADFPKALHAIIGIRCGMSLALENASLNNSKFFRLLVLPSLVLRILARLVLASVEQVLIFSLVRCFLNFRSFFLIQGWPLAFPHLRSHSFHLVRNYFHIYIYIYIYISWSWEGG